MSYSKDDTQSKSTVMSTIKMWLSRLGLKNTHTAFLQKGKTPPPLMSVLDMALNNLIGYNNTGALENAEYPFITITPRSTLARCGST